MENNNQNQSKETNADALAKLRKKLADLKVEKQELEAKLEEGYGAMSKALRAIQERKKPIKSQKENPNGLHARYHIQKIVSTKNPDFSPTARPSQRSDFNNYDQYIEVLRPVDKNAEYFVLRLDTGGSDINHIKACRIGIHAYADAIEATIPKLAEDLKKSYPLL